LHQGLFISKPSKKNRRHEKKSPDKKRKILAEKDPEDSRPVLIFAQDEGRFDRISDTRRTWSPPGCRPRSPRQVTRSYLYAYVAVCLGLGQMTALILPPANTEMMKIVLHQVSQDYPDYFIPMLVDQAGWHRSNKLEMLENINLIERPSHSPELNPVEHIWEESREKSFPNKALKHLCRLTKLKNFCVRGFMPCTRIKINYGL